MVRLQSRLFGTRHVHEEGNAVSLGFGSGEFSRVFAPEQTVDDADPVGPQRRAQVRAVRGSPGRTGHATTLGRSSGQELMTESL
ncbi:hypothetical protein GCM10028781_34620 [Nostocoides australiense]